MAAAARGSLPHPVLAEEVFHRGGRLPCPTTAVVRPFKFEESEAKRAHKLFVERQEATLVEGQRVTVRGYLQWEPDPDPAAMAGGYRSRPLRLTVRAPAGEQLLVVGEGVEREAEGERRGGEGDKPKAQPVVQADQGRRSLFMLLEVIALLAGIGLIILLVTC